MSMPTVLEIDFEPDESFDVEHCNPNYDPQKMKKKPSSVAAGSSASKSKASTEAHETMHHLQKTYMSEPEDHEFVPLNSLELKSLESLPQQNQKSGQTTTMWLPRNSSCCLLVLVIFVVVYFNHVSTSFLCLFRDHDCDYQRQRWTKPQAEVIPSTNSPNNNNNNTEEKQCTAQVLFDKPKGWSSLDGQLKWQVSEKARNLCNLDEPFLVPLQSSPRDIQQSLDKKWVVLVGDSSVRMIHDYLVGRWLGNLKHWPEEWDNHGPGNQHADMCAGPDKPCHFDVYNRGARVTFVWNSLLYTGELDAILRNNIGLPDVVVGQHGYWEKTWARDSPLNATEKGTALENAQSMPKKITDALERHEMESLYPRAYNPIQHGSMHKIWMTFFNKNALKTVYPGSSGDLYDGSRVAKKLGWDIFDRSKLVNAKGKHEGAHPMNEVLEIELEILLLILRNI